MKKEYTAPEIEITELDAEVQMNLTIEGVNSIVIEDPFG